MSRTLEALFFLIASVSIGACSPPRVDVPQIKNNDEGLEVIAEWRGVGGVNLGEPLGAAVDFKGDVFIADGLPGRLVFFDSQGSVGLEFEDPSQSPGFYPTDLMLKGFFVYAVDKTNRMVLRFDKDGAYRNILLNFNEPISGGRVSPAGMDVDRSGRIAITDVENHRILVFDAYLSLEMAFGSYGSFPGQFDTPMGVLFTNDGKIIVVDTGNRRLQTFGPGGRFIRAFPPENMGNPLAGPRRAAVDDNGFLYVADPDAGAVMLFDGDGRFMRSLRPRDATRFEPTDVSLFKQNLLYITDGATKSLLICRVMSY